MAQSAGNGCWYRGRHRSSDPPENGLGWQHRTEYIGQLSSLLVEQPRTPPGCLFYDEIMSSEGAMALPCGSNNDLEPVRRGLARPVLVDRLVHAAITLLVPTPRGDRTGKSPDCPTSPRRRHNYIALILTISAARSISVSV